MGYIPSDDDLPDLSKEAIASDLPDLSQSAILTDSNKNRIPQVIDDELSKLGWSDNARLAMVANVGRENAWNPVTIFGGHSDPVNQKFNRGIISWQNNRQTNLANFVHQNGGDFSPTERNLRLQAQFLDHEMRTNPEWKGIHSQMVSPSLSSDQAYPLLQKYIKYQPQYEANNRVWETKAQQLGLAKLPDLSKENLGSLPDLSQETDRPISPESGKPMALPSDIPRTPVSPTVPGPPVTLQSPSEPVYGDMAAVGNFPAVDEIGILGKPAGGVIPADKEIPAAAMTPKQPGAKIQPRTSEPAVTDVPATEHPTVAASADNAAADTVEVPTSITDKQKASDYVRKELEARHPGADFSKQGLIQDYEPGKPVGISKADLESALNAGGVTSSTEDIAARKKAEAIAPPTDEALRQKAIEELTNEKRAQGLNRFDRDAPGATPQNLDLTEAEIQSRVAEYKAQELSPEAKSRAYDVAQKNSGVLGGSILSGLYGGAGSIIHTAAGVLRPFSAVGIPSGYETLSNIGKEMQSVSGYRNEGRGAVDAGETIGGFLGEAIPSVAEMVVLPGGPVAKFAFLGGAKAAGAGAPLRDIGKGITEGGITGGGFKYAEELKNPLARLGTVFGSSVVANTAVGVPLDQSTRKAILNTTFQFVGDYAPKIIGGAKALAGTYRFWKGGEPVDVELTDKGEVILHSEIDTTDSNIKGEIVLDPENKKYKEETPHLNIGEDEAVGLFNQMSGPEIQRANESLKGDDWKATNNFFDEMRAKYGSPVPETQTALDAQKESAADQSQTERIAVMYPKGTDSSFNPKTEYKLVNPNGDVFIVNKEGWYAKAEEIGLQPTKTDLVKYTGAGKNEEAVQDLLGRKEVVADTSKGMAVEATQDGKQVDAAVVSSPETANAQIASYEQQHPNATASVAPVQDVVANRIADHAIEATEPTPGTVHKFSNTQVNLPKETARTVIDVGKKLIPDEELYVDPNDPSYGREESPHITVKYGLHSPESTEISRVLASEPKGMAKLGKISIFPGGENTPYDVVKADVESPDLHRLNKTIADNAQHTDTFPDYKPHVTLAYVKKGEGSKYIGNTELEGTEIPVDSVFFSGKDGKDVELPLSSDSLEPNVKRPTSEPKTEAELPQGEIKPDSEVYSRTGAKAEVADIRGDKALVRWWNPRANEYSDELHEVDLAGLSKTNPKEQTKTEIVNSLPELSNAVKSFMSDIEKTSTDMKGDSLAGPEDLQPPKENVTTDIARTSGSKNEAGMVLIPTVRQVKDLFRAIVDVQARAYHQGIREPLAALYEHRQKILDLKFKSARLTAETERAMEGMTEEQRTAIVDAAQHDYQGEYWNALDARQQAVALTLRPLHDDLAAYNRQFAVFSEKDLPEGMRYLFQWWNNPETGRPYGTQWGEFSKSGPSGKQSHIESYAEGRNRAENPLTMASTNLGEIMGKSMQQMMQVKEARDLTSGLKSWEYADANGSLLKGIVNRPPAGAEDRYVKMDIPALNPTQYIPQGEDAPGLLVRNDAYVLKEIAPALDAYFNKPEFSTVDSVLNRLKAIKLAGSFFHGLGLLLKNTSMMRYNSVGDIKRGFSFMDSFDPTMKILNRNGMDTALSREYTDIFEGSQQFHKDSALATADNFITHNPMVNLIFGTVRVGLKNSYAHDTYEKLEPLYVREAERVKGSSLNPEELVVVQNRAARDVVKKSDQLFSGEDMRLGAIEASKTMQKYYFSPDAQKWWSRLLISKTWNREHILEAKDVGKAFASLADPTLMGPVRREYFTQIAGTLVIAGVADLTNYFVTQWLDGKGTHMWNNPGGSKFSIRAPWNEPDGSAAFIRPFKAVTEVADVAATLFPSEWKKESIGEGLIDKLDTKISPGMMIVPKQLFYSQLKNVKPGWAGRGKELVKDIAPISFTTPANVYLGTRNPWGLVPWVMGATMQKPSATPGNKYPLINEVRSGKTTLEQGVEQLNKELENGNLTTRQYKNRLKQIHLSDEVDKARTLHAITDNDFNKVEDTLKGLSDDHKGEVRWVLENKINNLYKDKSGKGAKSAERLSSLVQKYLGDVTPVSPNY